MGICLIPLRFLIGKIAPRERISLWSGSPIINMGINARAERLTGTNAKSLVYSTYFITDEFDYDLSPYFSFPIIGKLLPFGVFLWVCILAKRLHFYCDRGLIPSMSAFHFNTLELLIYKLLRINVFLWTYGADVRCRDATINLGEPNCCTECTLIGKACICDDLRQKRHMDKLKRYSTAIFSMGDMIEYTPGSLNNLFFWPIDLEKSAYNPVYPGTDRSKPLRIVHSTNHRMYKGTHFLIEAIDSLKNEGCNIELILVEKIPNKQALEIYKSGDVLFDSCLIGFHGFLSIEGMAMGKAVMCFIRKPDKYLKAPEECPLINTRIKTLKDDLRNLAENRESVREKGIKGREYIEKYFSLKAFAERLKAAYKDCDVSL